MTRFLTVLLLMGLLTAPAAAQVQPFPADTKTTMVSVDGAELYVRVTGHGPAVVLLHGYTQTGDMWAPLAEELARDRMVIVPDLRGLGSSSQAISGYNKLSQAADIVRVLDSLGVSQADVVGHDIGTMVAFAFAASYPDRTRKLIVMEAPIPGIGPWDEILRSRELWHFSFGGPDMERLVAGRERIYFDRFWNEFSADPTRLTDATRDHYARAYAQPGAMRAGFANFATAEQDADDNRRLTAGGKLAMPVLAVGGERSFGTMMATVMRAAATDVREIVIAGSGHWLMEERPTETIAAVRSFLADTPR